MFVGKDRVKRCFKNKYQIPKELQLWRVIVEAEENWKKDRSGHAFDSELCDIQELNSNENLIFENILTYHQSMKEKEFTEAVSIWDQEIL